MIHAKANRLLVQLAEAMKLPVVTAFRRFDAFPNSHPCYAGGLDLGHLNIYLMQSGCRCSFGIRDTILSSRNTRLHLAF